MDFGNRETLAKEMEKKVVTISLDGNFIIGHGVVISPDGLIATSCHLFKEEKEEEDEDNEEAQEEEKGESQYNVGSMVGIKFYGDIKQYLARICKLESRVGIALLKIVSEVDTLEVPRKFDFAKLAKKIPKFGQEVHMVVSVDEINFGYLCGSIAYKERVVKEIVDRKSIAYLDENLKLLQIHNLHGGSECLGAPIFNSNMEVVGILAVDYKRISFAVPSYHLQQVWDSFLSLSSESGSEIRKRKTSLKGQFSVSPFKLTYKLMFGRRH